MTIDAVPHACVQKSAQGAQSANTPRTSPKSKTGGAAPEGPSDAFQSLLAGMDAAAVGADAVVPEAAGQAGPDAAPAEDPLATPPNRKKAGPAKTAADATALDPSAVVGHVPVLPVLPMAPSVADDVVAAAAGVPVAEAVAAPSQAVGDTAVAGNAALPVAVDGGPESLVNRANYASVFEQMQSRVAVDEAAPPDLGQSPVSVLKEAQRKANMALAATEMRADRASGVAAGSAWSLPVTAPSASQSLTGLAEELQAAVREKASSTGTTDAKLPEGAVQHHFTPTVQFEVANATLGPSQATPEAAVAEQVNYWIAQGIQNAELTLDGAGNQPVEVSISLSGNTAHVEFRTDQLETRELLSGAATHLKDLLQQEGMVLSGLSVGSSGAGGAGGRERRGSAETRQSAAHAMKVDSVAGSAGPARATSPFGSSGRAVDYFV